MSTKETGIESTGYAFNKARHFHSFDGKPLSGVTTILAVIAKPALIQWAANQAVEYIKAHATVYGPVTAIVPVEAIEAASSAHRKKKETAGDWGTQVHAWVEAYIKASIDNTDAPQILEGLQGDSCKHFIKWATDNKVKFLESEKNVWSTEMWIGGITDIVCEIDGQKWIADVKTGSGIYPEHFFQMAAYGMCLKEMGAYDGVAGHIVLNLTKDGKFNEKRSVSNEDNEKAFLAALTLYRTQEKIKNQVL